MKKKKIKESKIDQVFSLFIRQRDGTCVYPLRSPDDYHAGNLQNSHFYGRTARSVRWDEENCDAICGRHHQFLEGRKNAEYLWWKKQTLGEEKFKALTTRYVRLKQYTQSEKVELMQKLTESMSKS